MQKKWIAAAFACFLMLTPATSFAADNSLDDDYMDVVFGKLSELDDADKDKYSAGLKLNMGGDSSLQGLQDNWKSRLSASQVQELSDLGISDKDVEDNIEKLKSWDLDDRLKLVDYAVDGNQAGVEALNNKYGDDDSDSSSSSKGKGSSGGSGGSGGSGASSAPAADENVPIVTVEDESLPQGAVQSAAVRLGERGLISHPLSVSAQNKVEAYSDMSTHWSKDYVGFFMDRDIISGRSETEFAPDAAITNSEIITLISKVVVQDPDQLGDMNEMTFTDVDDSAWYAGYAKQLGQLGVLKADGTSALNPDVQPKRQEIVKMLIDTLDALELETGESTPSVLMAFDDAREIEPANFNAMQRAVALGLINGMGDGRLAPDDGVTRGQIAVMLKHFHDYVLSQIEEVTS